MKKDLLEVLEKESDKLHERLDEIDSIKNLLSNSNKPENIMIMEQWSFKQQPNNNTTILQALISTFGEMPSVLFNLLIKLDLEKYFCIYEDSNTGLIVIELKDDE